jgi:hypothetical protein
MRCSWIARLVVLQCAAVLALSAQQRGPSPGAPLCEGGGAPIVDTIVAPITILAGTAWNRHAYTVEERQRILFIADAIRQRFAPPASLGTTTLLGEQFQRASGGTMSYHSAVGGKLVLVLKSNGRLRTKFWQVQPFSAPFATALAQAVIAADSAHDFEGVPPSPNTGGFDDTLVVQVRSAPSGPSPEELTLMRAQLMSYRLDDFPRRLKAGTMHYPPNLGNAGVENQGEMQVVIGSNGRAVMPASQITRLDWRDFINTMRGAVEESTYEPATSGGCKVPAIVIASFTFLKEKP